MTLLEVNTVAHVYVLLHPFSEHTYIFNADRPYRLCAFAMYAFWWHKPLLPNQPIIIRDRDLQSLAAFMYSSSEMSGYVNPKRIRSQTVVKTALAGLNLFSKAPELETLCFRTPHLPTSGFDPAATVDRAPPSCVDQLGAQRQKETGTAFFERRPRVVDRRPTDDFVTGADQRRWALVKHALIRYSVLTEHKSSLALAHEVDGESCLHLRPGHLVASYIKNWPSNDLLRSVDGLIVGMVLWLANFCYGGIHAAAWNDHFPSEPEKWLWRASASYTGFCGGLWVVLNLLVAKYQRLNDFWEQWMDGKKSRWQSFALGTVVGVCGVSLFLARFFIVLESFVSIRRMPLSAYQTPEWTDILPHF